MCGRWARPCVRRSFGFMHLNPLFFMSMEFFCAHALFGRQKYSLSILSSDIRWRSRCMQGALNMVLCLSSSSSSSSSSSFFFFLLSPSLPLTAPPSLSSPSPYAPSLFGRGDRCTRRYLLCSCVCVAIIPYWGVSLASQKSPYTFSSQKFLFKCDSFRIRWPESCAHSRD